MKVSIYKIFSKKYLTFCLVLICSIWISILLSEIVFIGDILLILTFVTLVINFIYIVYKIIKYNK